MKSFQAQTHYEVLEISVGASPAEVRSAYERLSLLYSDDQVVLYGLINPSQAVALRSRLKEALEVLSDDQRRESYDVKIGLPPRVVAPKAKPVPKPSAPQSQAAGASAGTGWGTFAWVTPGGPAQTPTQPASYTYAVTPAATKSVAAPPPVMVVPVPARVLAVPPTPPPPAKPPPAPAPAEAPAAAAPPAEPRQLALDVPSGVTGWGLKAIPEPVSAGPLAEAPSAPSAPVAIAAAPSAPPPPVAPPSAPAPVLVAASAPAAPPSAPAPVVVAASAPPAPVAAPSAPAPVVVAASAPVAPVAAPSAPAPVVVSPEPAPSAPAAPVVAVIPAPPEVLAAPSAPPAPVALAAEAPAAVPAEPPAPAVEEPPIPILADDAQVAIIPARATPSREFRVEQRPRPYEIPEGVEINGDLLKQVRMARGLSLIQVAERTRIGVKHLENVEGDRYDALPAAVYLRGILMNLARELGLDGLRVSKSYLTFVEAHRSKG